ncbi:hypothetical protein T03_14185 [Trichinella britovi]|uniref:Uncharacterized protein n=1 Tax=Trichinella britovi TaxID=45882 RepID=A0A0V1AMK5_TRIBR|nr:hypothetical protein T03_14185 [Trichinella britovi]
MANKADELIALSNNGSGSICTVKKKNGDKAPTLEERIEDLEERRPDDAPRTPSPKRRSSSRAGRHTSPVCYFHRKFGTRARKCRSPCRYQGNGRPRTSWQ